VKATLKERRIDVVRRLKLALKEIDRMCREQGDALAGPIQWPYDKFLDDLSSDIHCLASLYDLGNKSIWSCILAIENKRTSLNLRGRIEDLVSRASKLYQVPRAIQIQRQARAGSSNAKACFKNLQKCFKGQREIRSIDWEQHHAILAPKTSLERCETLAAQICID
jgi:hypothetical protein